MQQARAPRRAAVLLACCTLVVSCSGSGEQPPGTVGPLPEPSGPDTLLPVIPDTGPAEVSTTLPPDALFGADLCQALAADDFRGVRFGSSTSGRLQQTLRVSEDSCQFDVLAGSTVYPVLVRARSQPDFVTPTEGDEEIEELDGPGLAARGVQFDDRYEVTVKVDNGYFAVAAPTRDAALALAAKAVPRADDPPPPSTSTTIPKATPSTSTTTTSTSSASSTSTGPSIAATSTTEDVAP